MAAASRSLFQFQGSSRSSSWALVRPETTRSSTSVSHARGSTPFSFAVTLVHGSVRVASEGKVGEEGDPFHDPRPPAVPFKANAARRHRIPKQRHRVTNWAAYEAGLRQRGSLTVHGRGGGRGLAGGAAHDPGRAALVLGPGDPDRADAAGRVPPGPAPDRGADRLHHPPARPRAGRARPHHAEPSGRNVGGAASTGGSRAAAPSRGQHGAQAVWRGRVAGREARHEEAGGGGGTAPPRGGRGAGG